MLDEFVLYGTKVGAEKWQEQIIWVTTDGDRWARELEQAKAWAISEGFDRLRTKVYSDKDLPTADSLARMFANTVNI